MELLRYDTANCPTKTGRHTKAFFRVGKKDGTVRLSKPLVELLCIKYGDRVEFYQDQNKKENWYIAKGSDQANGFIIKKSNATLMFSNKAFVFALSEQLGTDEVSYKMQVSKHPVELKDGLCVFPIITKSLTP